MKILWVKADKLFPIENGGNIRSYHLLRYLSSHHDLTFCSYYSGDADLSYERELETRLPGAVALCTGRRKLSTLARGLDYLAHLAADEPYAVSRFASPVVRDRLRLWFEAKSFDVAVCDFLDAAINFPERLTIPSVLFQHNVESEIWRRHAATTKNPVKKIMYRTEFQKMLRYERSSIGRFGHIIAVSDHDRSLMAQWSDSRRFTVVPTGVDLEQYRPSAAIEEAGPLVSFIGAMDWEPNVDGVEYFCSQVWPAVKSAVPMARFRIVGRNPDRRVLKWASDSIEITGRVPSVVDHLRQSSVVVVPLRIGGGTRLKIYEAMATAKAVVSTSVGAEGLDVHNGRDILLADDSTSFSQAVLMLLRDRELRRRHEAAAAETAARYDWEVIGERFSAVLQSVVEKNADAAGAVPAGRA